ncbi:hypothetical protein [Paraburkholderia sp. J8-2]|uniref:hypothetical protein n=1 Tax=Paraburkholderia sp. J8-2 TaxID=2805440 RepID=UPI002AB6C0EA|nr:hypothetical protein [Paraburkholderia sp. J8-2]
MFAADFAMKAQIIWASLLVVLSYPCLWLFLRRYKRVPVRFNWAVAIAIASAGLLPMEFAGVMRAQSATSVYLTDRMVDTMREVVDFTLLCQGDRTKVPAARLDQVKRELAESTLTWMHIPDMKQMSTAQWLKQAEPCDGFVRGQENRRTDDAQFQSIMASFKWWVLAALVTGLVGIVAVYQLAVSRIREDMRKVQQDQPVKLTGREWACFFLICLMGFFPFSLSLVSLVDRPQRSPKRDGSANPQSGL